MNPKTRVVLAVVAVLLLGIQLVPVDRENPPVTGTVDAPEQVMNTFRRACFDCHSNETAWPWYSRIAPVSWLVAYDVKEGREHVNFSTWTTLDAEDRAHALEEIVEVMEEKEMPLRKYVALHPGAELSSADRRRLIDWAEGASALAAGDSAP